MVLNAGLLVQSIAEISMWSNGKVSSWMLVPIMITNICGMLDAMLRYPILHNIDSAFTCKQILIVVVRVNMYVIGWNNLRSDAGWFLLWLLAGIVTLPCLYVFALPFADIRCQHMKNSAVDEDILLRLWRKASNPVERRQLRTELRLLTRKGAVQIVRAAPSLKTTIVLLDPSLAGLLCNNKLSV